MSESSSARPNFGQWSMGAAAEAEAGSWDLLQSQSQFESFSPSQPDSQRWLERAVWAVRILAALIRATVSRKCRRNTEGYPLNPPADNAHTVLRRVVFEVLRGSYGDMAVIFSGSGNSMIAVHGPADPLAAAHAAKALMVPLRNLVGEFVRAARGQGRSWLSVAQALGFGEEDWSPEWAAFSYVAGAPKHSDERPSLEWRCGSCGCPVTDLGPDVGPNPSDREQGHTYDCDRHSAEVRAFLDQFGGN